MDMLAPVLLATGIVLGQAGQVDGSAWVVVRPLLLGGLLGAVVYGFAALVARTRPQAILGSTIVVALLGGLAFVLVVISMALVSVVVLYWRHIRGYGPLQLGVLATMATRATAIFALVGLGNFVLSGPVLSYPRLASVKASAAELPPIYLILLDGYPRHDMLDEHFAVDNGPFLDALADRNFDVYPDATSNYHFTGLALATMFNATPAAALHIDETTKDEQFRALHRSFNGGSVWNVLREVGYSIATIPPTPDGVKLMTADMYLDQGQITGFEVHLVESTGLGALFDLAGFDLVNDQHRSRLDAAFEMIPEVAQSGRFVLAHLFLPHRPLVFHADGSARGEDACQVECTDAEFYPAFAEQLAYTNRRVIEVVDQLPSDAVVVIFSDHGSREVDDPLEWLRTLLVARTPDHPGLFGDEPQPLSWLPRLLNTYAGTDLPESDGGHWRSYELPMDMEPVHP